MELCIKWEILHIVGHILAYLELFSAQCLSSGLILSNLLVQHSVIKQKVLLFAEGSAFSRTY